MKTLFFEWPAKSLESDLLARCNVTSTELYFRSNNENNSRPQWTLVFLSGGMELQNLLYL